VQAVGLLAGYSLRDVMKTLHMDHRRLSRWRCELSAPQAPLSVNGFVELPLAPLKKTAAPPLAELTLTYHGANGRAVSLTGQLSEAQWRWALGLLQGKDHDAVDGQHPHHARDRAG
jgi:hypothetical protein